MKGRTILIVFILGFLLSGCGQAEMSYMVYPDGEIMFRGRVAFSESGPEVISIVSALAQHWEEQGYMVYKGVDPGELGVEKILATEARDTEGELLAELLGEHAFVVEEINFIQEQFGASYALQLSLDFSGIVSEDELAALPRREAEAALAGLDELELLVAFELPGKVVETNADRVILTGAGVRLEWDFAYGDSRDLVMATHLRHPLLWWVLAGAAAGIVLLVLLVTVASIKHLRRKRNNEEKPPFEVSADE